MSNSKEKNFGEILNRLRHQVTENSDNIKQILDSNNKALESNQKLLETVSHLEDSISTLVELKERKTYASLLSRIEALEKI